MDVQSEYGLLSVAFGVTVSFLLRKMWLSLLQQRFMGMPILGGTDICYLHAKWH